MKKQGRIIRIIDPRTAIINLGRKDGVDRSSVFSVLGTPEPVVDPISGEELGRLAVVKTKLKADHVDDRFSIAITQWTILSTHIHSLGLLEDILKYETIDHGEMTVRKDDLQPWKAQAEIPVQVGDAVEVDVRAAHEENPEAESFTSEGAAELQSSVGAAGDTGHS